MMLQSIKKLKEINTEGAVIDTGAEYRAWNGQNMKRYKNHSPSVSILTPRQPGSRPATSSPGGGVYFNGGLNGNQI